jgi:3D (Asp-Asp-Asp) domain-containing protein
LRLATVNVLVATTLGLLLLAVSWPADAQAESPLGGAGYVRGTGGKGARVRSGPGLEHRILGKVPDGTHVSVLSGPQSSDGHDWYEIKSTDGALLQLQGWVSGTYLVPAGRIAPPGGSNGGRNFMAVVTGYTSPEKNGPLTFTGTQVRRGTVAVDPSVIPLGSLLTIEGVEGVFRAEDKGRLVKGAALDVWFPDRTAALQWGAQRRTVSIVREGY